MLVVRPGLPEAAETRGHEWLVERVDEVLGKVAHDRRALQGWRPRRSGSGSSALPLDVRPARAGRDLQVPPELLASTRSRRSASTASSRARRSPAGACCAATRGHTAGWTTREPPWSSASSSRSRTRVSLAARALPLRRRAHLGLGDRRRRRSSCGSALVPLTVRQIHSMQALQRHAPEMKEIQRKYKGDRQKMNEEMMKFYKENNINPAASCLPLLAQAPVFISLYFVLQNFSKHVPPGSRSLVAPLRPQHHREGELALVRLRAARRLRREPDLLDLLHVAGDGQDPAADDDGAAARSSSRSSRTSRSASSSTG